GGTQPAVSTQRSGDPSGVRGRERRSTRPDSQSCLKRLSTTSSRFPDTAFPIITELVSRVETVACFSPVATIFLHQNAMVIHNGKCMINSANIAELVPIERDALNKQVLLSLLLFLEQRKDALIQILD